jgi:hypothetical protein
MTPRSDLRPRVFARAFVGRTMWQHATAEPFCLAPPSVQRVPRDAPDGRVQEDRFWTR